MNNLPPVVGPLPHPGATAWLVGWQDSVTGKMEDAGIYSEATPTCTGPVNGRHLRPVALLTMRSRFDPAAGGYQRASDQLAALVAKTPSLAWVARTRTFQLMERNRTTVRRGTRLVARHVVR